MDVVGFDLLHPDAIGRLENVVQAIGRGLVGAHQAEIATFGVQPHDIAQIRAHHARCFGLRSPGIFDIHGVGLEVRKAQFALEQTAVGVRISAHPPTPSRRQRGDVGG